MNINTNHETEILLKSLITQMQNQDPMNPMDNKEMMQFLQQMYQISEMQKQNICLKSIEEKIDFIVNNKT